MWSTFYKIDKSDILRQSATLALSKWLSEFFNILRMEKLMANHMGQDKNSISFDLKVVRMCSLSQLAFWAGLISTTACDPLNPPFLSPLVFPSSPDVLCPCLLSVFVVIKFCPSFIKTCDLQNDPYELYLKMKCYYAGFYMFQ